MKTQRITEDGLMRIKLSGDKMAGGVTTKRLKAQTHKAPVKKFMPASRRRG